MPNPLLEHIIRHIRHHGPMTVAKYMETCLGHPQHGYYIKQDPFGKKGDFTTAPEISQMFGEMIAAWCLQCWHDMGKPSEFHLIEQGPGRGTLMADILRIAKNKPDFMASVNIHLIEISPTLKQAQQKTLNDYPVQWHQSLSDITWKGPVLILGNEFFDALPVHQFVYHEKNWREKGITTDDNNVLSYALMPPSYDPRMLALEKPAEEGDVMELCPLATAIIDDVSRVIEKQGGAALYIDYGYSTSAYGDTLQGLKNHAYYDILETPGDADITAHVDFGRLCRIAAEYSTEVFGPVVQGAFLKALGIEMRAQQLSHLNPSKADEITTGLNRLIGPAEMGTLFKVIALSQPGLTVAGFDNVYAQG